MSYVLPALRVHQEFEAIADATSNRLYACIIAPNYGLHRYSEEDEKAELGSYDPASNNVFNSYPDKAAGSVIDVDSNKIYVDNGILQYHSESMLAGSLLIDAGNKIESTLVFATANGVARSGAFGSRDVAVGDPIKVTANGIEIESTVAGLIADVEAATVQATPDLVNSPGDVVAGNTNDLSGIDAPGDMTIVASEAAYKGLGAGVVSETYTCEVIAITNGGITGTFIKITSASGLDDVASQAMASLPQPLGSRGATFTTVLGTGAFAVGDTFVLGVSEGYTEATPVASGTFSGSKDSKYIVTVTQGGTIADAGDADPIVQVSTTNGVDAGEPITITALGAIAIGNYGVALEFDSSDTQLIKGSAFTIDVTIAGAGAVHTLALADSLTGMTTTDPLVVDFRLNADFELSGVQWTSDENSVTVYAAAQNTNSYLGSSQAMDIISGDMFIQYRELLITFVDILSSVATITEAALICGPAVTENPLGLLVNKALTNSNGMDVYFIATASESDSDYEDAIDALTTDTTIYSLVPHSNSLAVRDAVQAHCLSMSTPDNGLWRIYWISAEMDRVTSVYTEGSLGEDILGTISSNVLTGYLDNLAETPALFSTNGVVAGDTVRINYSGDAYDEYVVDEVMSEFELRLLNAPDNVVGIKLEVWNEASRAEYADMISSVATHSNHRRGYSIWSEPVYDGNNPDGLPLSAICAALAGLRSGVAPHQPLTNVSLAGFSMTRTVNFRSSELNTMAGNGTWLVVQTLEGSVYNRHQVSTDNDDINHREQTITTNLDHISRDFKSAMANYYGRGNVSPGMLDLIGYTAKQKITEIESRVYAKTIGPQLLGAEITTLEVNAVLRDSIDLVITPELPYPLNNLEIYFIIS